MKNRNLLQMLIVLAAFWLAPLVTLAQTGPVTYRTTTIAGLRAITLYGPTNSTAVAWVGGGTVVDDGQGGVFFYDGTSTSTTNAYFTIFKPANNNGRWFRLPQSVAWQQGNVTVADDTTYGWKFFRAGTAMTNFFGIGADNNSALLQTFNSKLLQLNNQGNNIYMLGGIAGQTNAGVAIGRELIDDNAKLTITSTNSTTFLSLYNLSAAGAVVRFGVNASGVPTINNPNGASLLLQSSGGSTVLQGGLTVGTSGSSSNLLAILTTNAALTFGAIPALTNVDLTTPLVGASTNDIVLVGPPPGLQQGVDISAFVSATNVLTVRGINFTTNAITPTAASLYRLQVNHWR